MDKEVKVKEVKLKEVHGLREQIRQVKLKWKIILTLIGSFIVSTNLFNYFANAVCIGTKA